MIIHNQFFLYLLVMAGVTYLIRMLPFVLFRKKIQNRFVLSFLYYVPFSVITVMTIPDVFSSTGNIYSSLVGFLTAVLLSFLKQKLPVVAVGASIAALLAEIFLRYVFCIV